MDGDEIGIKELSDVATPRQLARIADSLERLEVHLRMFLELILATRGFSDKLERGEVEGKLLAEMQKRWEQIQKEMKSQRKYPWKEE